MLSLLLLTAAVMNDSTPKFPPVRGAVVDETSVRVTLEVPSPATPTLAAAFEQAHVRLVEGTPVRILIRAGTYRESVTGLDWTQGKAADTPLVVEGAGKVLWTGSDEFAAEGWEAVGPLWRHRWEHRFGNFAYSWGPKRLIGHRTEMAFADGVPLMPRILERWQITGVKQDPAVVNQVDYRPDGLNDPAETLRPGEFGVTELPEHGGWVYVRLPVGQTPRTTRLEVSVRRRLLDLIGKNRVVLRNLTFQHAANDDGDFGSRSPVMFGHSRGRPSSHVLIDRCRFLWNATTGLHLGGNHWTIRDSVFNGNGFSGIASGPCQDVLFQRNETSFNAWRAWRGGEIGYFTGGFKMHEADDHRVEGHLALTNCTAGIWWDIHCHRTYVRDAVLVDNSFNLQYELSTGPFVGDRLLLAGGRFGDGMAHLWAGETILENCLFWNDYRGEGRTVLYGFRIGERDDPHANLREMKPGLQRVRRSLMVAGPNVAAFAMMDDVRKRSRSGWSVVPYEGRDNVFWHPDDPNFAQTWVGDAGRPTSDDPLTIADWRARGGHREVGERRLDPMLIDPLKGDFRIGPDSPLFPERQRWPQVKLTESQRRQMAWFEAWSGFSPRSWPELPPE